MDQLKLLRGKPITIKDGLVLLQPRIDEIEELGEQSFMNVFWLLCSSAWDMPAAFADMGVDFMSVTDWNFFMQTVLGMPFNTTKLVFKDIDFSKLEPMLKQLGEEQSIVLVNKEPMILDDKEFEPRTFEITEDDYNVFIKYVREMIGFQHKGRKAKNRATAKILIQEDRKESARNKNKPYESMILNAIISLVNTEEFGYTYETVFEMTIFQLMKSLVQIQGKKHACALLQGSMSGFCDTSKIPSKEFQWMYSEDRYGKSVGRTLKDQLAPNGGSLNIK